MTKESIVISFLERLRFRIAVDKARLSNEMFACLWVQSKLFCTLVNNKVEFTF